MGRVQWGAVESMCAFVLVMGVKPYDVGRTASLAADV